jgi:hypothetical protein
VGCNAKHTGKNHIRTKLKAKRVLWRKQRKDYFKNQFRVCDVFISSGLNIGELQKVTS